MKFHAVISRVKFFGLFVVIHLGCDEMRGGRERGRVGVGVGVGVEVEVEVEVVVL